MHVTAGHHGNQAAPTHGQRPERPHQVLSPRPRQVRLPLLDVLRDRQAHADASTSALHLATVGAVQGYLCASGVDTLAYLLRKGAGRVGVMRDRITLRRILRIAEVTESVIDSALRLG